MALAVPDDPKKYTTIYNNFKGVDFTNDSTNVYKLRSPDAVNMIPDMDGHPEKRHGWEIAIPDTEFQTLANKSVGVTTEKVAYCEIGGIDFLLIFNSLGFFSYGGDEGLKYHDYSYSYNGSSYTQVASLPELDPNKSFFFEGQGEAGYYLFEKNGMTLFRFTIDEDTKVSYVLTKETYIPTTHIACTPTLTSSTMYENVNLLTAKRHVQYMGDGISPANYSLPSKAATGTIVVEVLESGIWQTKTSGTDYNVSADRTVVTFTAGHIPASSTVDNVKITYEPDGSTLATTTTTVTRDWKEVTVKRTGTQTRYKAVAPSVYHGTSPVTITGVTPREYYTNWSTSWSGYKTGSATFDVSGLYQKQYTVQYQDGNTAKTLPEHRSVDFTSYSNKVVITIGSALYGDSNYSPKKDETTYGATSNTAYGSWSSKNVKTNLTDRGFTQQQSDNLLKAAADATTVIDRLKIQGTPTPYQSPLYVTCVKQTRTITRTKTYKIRVTYTQSTTSGSKAVKINRDRLGFKNSGRVIVYGNGLINQVFIGASTYKDYTNRVWYSAVTDVSYFPDLNYMEVGSNDTRVMGMMKVGEYLGVIKQGSTLDSSVYLAYPTSFNDDTAYAVKQKVAGVGAISNGAFNVLNDEPLFLSNEGVMAIVPAENEEKQLKNRSYYINKKLLDENNLAEAVSFVWKNMYLLAVDNHVYILDGSQKSSWANERTNLQYECYYCDNVPAKCFAKIDNELWFADNSGNLCRFKDDKSENAWYDDYSAEGGTNKPLTDTVRAVVSDIDGTDNVVVDPALFGEYVDYELGTYEFSLTAEIPDGWTVYKTNDVYIEVDSDGVPVSPIVLYEYDEDYQDFNVLSGSANTYYYVVGWVYSGTYGTYADYRGYAYSNDNGFYEYGLPASVWIYRYNSGSPHPVTNPSSHGLSADNIYRYVPVRGTGEFLSAFFTVSLTAVTGYPIYTKWSTIMDDDGTPQYFKNLMKKGTMVILSPSSNSGVQVSLRADNKDLVTLGGVTVQSPELPVDFYTKKKIKKYKRLQIICENDGMRDSFGIDKIIKTYTVGNYSKNR